MNTRTKAISCLALGVLCAQSIGDIEVEGTALALASHNADEDRNTIDLSSTGTSSGSVSSSFGDASSVVTVSLDSSSAETIIDVEYTLDSGSVPVGAGSTDGYFTFTVPADTEFSFEGLLETITNVPSTGGGVLIRNDVTGAIAYQAFPNITLPNRPTDFSEIHSSGSLFAGTYELSWIHSAIHIFSTAPAISTGNFTLTLSPPGCNPADFTRDGVLNFFDVAAFLDAYAIMDPDADLNGDGTFNFFDVADFLDEYLIGCP